MHFFIFSIFTILILSSCGNNDKSSNLSNPKATVAYKTVDHNLAFPKREEYCSDKVFIRGAELRRVSIVKSGGLSNFNVEFPEIDDFADNNIVAINRLIYDTIVADGMVNNINLDIFEFKDSWIDIDITYEVTYASDSVLSLHFFGSITGGGIRGYVPIQKAITIDLDNAAILSLGDFFTYEKLEKIIESLLASENNLRSGDYLFSADDPWRFELLEKMKEHLSWSLLNNELLSNIRYFYLTENGIGFIGSLTPVPNYIIVEVLIKNLF